MVACNTTASSTRAATSAASTNHSDLRVAADGDQHPHSAVRYARIGCGVF